MRIADGLEALELVMNPNNPAFVINPALIWDAEHAVLVDTGMPGGSEAIRAAMEQAGVPLDKLTHVILTHQDVDHIGGLKDLLELLPHPVEVLAHAADRPYMEGELPLIKWNPARLDAMFEALPEPQREAAKARFSAALQVKVDRTVEDGEVLPFGGGVRVVFTPGHTPGHISLYHEASGTLLAGDALTAPGGALQGPNQAMTPDKPAAMASVAKIAAIAPKAVLCYHGGLVSERVQESLAELASQQV